MTKKLGIPLKSNKIAEEDNKRIIRWGVRNRQDKDSINNEETHRTKFRRERDRILYSGGFRRLQDKTQVMSAVKTGDHRTRLTHSLEVEQIAMSVADALMLNRDIVSAIALGHDVGHTPFGHAVERLLDKKLKDEGGFSHAIQSARYLHSRGIELSYEIIEGILKHDTDVFVLDNDNNKQFPPCSDYNLNKPGTLEAQIVYWADKIAYITHDYEDFVKNNILDKVIKSREFNQFDLCCILASLMIHSNEQSNNSEDNIKILDILIDINNFRTRDLIRNILSNLIHTSYENIYKLGTLEVEEYDDINKINKEYFDEIDKTINRKNLVDSKETLNKINEKYLDYINENILSKTDKKKPEGSGENNLIRIEENLIDNIQNILKSINEKRFEDDKEIILNIIKKNLDDNREIMLNSINEKNLEHVREITLKEIENKQKEEKLDIYEDMYKNLEEKKRMDVLGVRLESTTDKVTYLKNEILVKLRENYELEREQLNNKIEQIKKENTKQREGVKENLKEINSDTNYEALIRYRKEYENLKRDISQNKDIINNKCKLDKLSKDINEKEKQIVCKFKEEIKIINLYLEEFNKEYFIRLKLENKEKQLNKLNALKEELKRLDDFKNSLKTEASEKEIESSSLKKFSCKEDILNYYIEINKNIEEYKKTNREIEKLEKEILSKEIAKIKKKSYQDGLLINLSNNYRLKYLALRDVIDKYYIQSEEIQFSDAKAEKIVEYLYDMFTKRPEILPIERRKMIEDNKRNKNRVVADYISSMSDRYAEEIYMNLNSTAKHYEY